MQTANHWHCWWNLIRCRFRWLCTWRRLHSYVQTIKTKAPCRGMNNCQCNARAFATLRLVVGLFPPFVSGICFCVHPVIRIQRFYTTRSFSFALYCVWNYSFFVKKLCILSCFMLHTNINQIFQAFPHTLLNPLPCCGHSISVGWLYVLHLF